MSEREWKRAMSEAGLEEEKPFVATVGETEVMVVRTGGRIVACANRCTHYGGPLAEGLLLGDKVICPWHNARFDITTGRKDAPPGLAALPTYDVKSEDGEIYVRPREAQGGPGKARAAQSSVLIIGAGAAGDTAAETLREGGFGGTITLLTQEREAPYDRTVLSKGFLSGEAKPEWLPLRDADFYEKGKIGLRTGSRVVGFDPESRTATLEDGGRLQAEKVLLCTGSVPRRLEVPGEELENCFYLRSKADAERLLAAAEHAAKAVILGGSFIGLETASGLRARGVEVHVVAPEPVPLETVFGREVGERVRRIHEENGVAFHLGHTAREIRGGEAVREVVLDNGESLAADLVIIGIGVRPAVGYLEASGLLEKGVVPVNGRLETKYPGVYAAGDIASVPDAHGEGSVRIEHWVVAQRHGMHAAQTMMGATEDYREPPFFWTMQYGNSIKFTGVAARYDEVVFRGDVENGAFSAGYFTRGSLTAVSTIGRGRDVLIGGELLKEDVVVTPAQFRETADLEELLP